MHEQNMENGMAKGKTTKKGQNEAWQQMCSRNALARVHYTNASDIGEDPQ